MKERERLIASGLVILMLVLWLGFLVHRSPRFAGSLGGHSLGIAGGLLMLAPLAYLAVKRVPPLKRLVTRRVAMRTLLALHIYAGMLGPILVLLHTSHKFGSTLGVVLTAMTLLVVLSGFTGRYLLVRFSQSIQENKGMLTQLEVAYRETVGELAAHPEQMALLRPLMGFRSHLASGFFQGGLESVERASASPVCALRLAEAMADLEYTNKTHGMFRRWFADWLKLHIVISSILYGLLMLHVWATIHFGLRWLS
jgi:hypothetical protein